MKSFLRWTAASLAAVFLVSAPQKSQAQVFLGNSSTVWSDGANWVGGVAPSGTTAITFADAPINVSSTNDIVGLTVLGINLTNGSPALYSNTVNNTTAFTLNGNKIILGGNIVTSAQSHDGVPTNNRLIRDTINLDMDLNGSRTFTTNQTGTNNVNQTQHALVINGNIGETALGVGNLTKSGGQVLTLNGTNTFTGGITITAGIIASENLADALGSNNIRSSNGNFQYIGTGNQTFANTIDMYNTNNQGLTLQADGVGGANSTITYNGLLTSNNGTQTKTLTLTGANTALNTFASNITNGAAVFTQVTKAGNGRWVVGTDNTYSGVTNVNAGTLNVSNLQDNLALPSSIGQNATLNFSGGQLRYAATTVGAQVIANRTITLPGTNNQGATILNDSANDGASNNTLVFNGGFTIPAGTQAKTLTLSGSNTGSNTWNAVIPNGPVAATNLTKAGAGQWLVTSNNTFTGTTNVNAGTLSVQMIDDNVATPQPLGVNANTTFNGGTLNYIGTNSITISANRTFSLIGNGQLNNNAAAGNTVTFSGNWNTVPGTAENNNTRTLTLGGGNTGANQVTTSLADSSFTNGNGTFRKPVALQKLNGGLWEVTSTSAFSGPTTIQQGTLVVSAIGNKGVAGNLGTGSEVGMAGGNVVGNATIRLGTGGNSGVLRYTGAGESSNRLFQIGQLTAQAVAPGNQGGGGQIISNGSGGLNLTGEGGFFNEAVTANSTAARVLTLGGTFAGVNSIGATIQDNILVGNGTSAQVRLIKNGATTWALNGANSYSGNTTITAGTLLINGSTAAGDVIVTGGSLGGSGTVGGDTFISANLSPGNSPGVLTFAQDLTLAANSTFTWDLASNTEAGRGTSFDGVDVGGALSINPTANSNLRFNDAGSTVNFNDAFWLADRSWLVFDNANAYAGSVFGAISQTADSLANAAPIGTFSWGLAGGDVVLNYTAIPEPSSILLTVLGLAGAGLRRSRKRSS